jgi:hypothetical protein
VFLLAHASREIKAIASGNSFFFLPVSENGGSARKYFCI